jgi:hypothetical protein
MNLCGIIAELALAFPNTYFEEDEVFRYIVGGRIPLKPVLQNMNEIQHKRPRNRVQTLG